MAERIQQDVTFSGARGCGLAGILDLPAGEPRGYALFAHCFTCTKDFLAPARISRGLAERDIAVLRFDFTGLGDSCGDFAETSFSTNVQDVVAAARYLHENHGPPRVLIGHSLGGAAALAAAADISEARAVVSIAAPAGPARLSRLVGPVAEEIRREGAAEVVVAGRPFRIGRAFVDDVDAHSIREVARKLRAALLVLHSTTDDVVSIESAREIYSAARHPKSFISLDGVDHLVRKRRDAAWVTALIDSWASRYLEPEG